ncbi:MAG: hypothetical protein OIF56_03375 [Cohaesibacter sp.]|nr:hypothetical protein [Cohaesibacter sp.]MCV6599967.1 hypothetical protein [Cohaesibacter sp.]
MTKGRIAPLLALLSGMALSAMSSANAQDHAIPDILLDGHRQTMGCWLADIDNQELLEKALVIDLGVHKFYGFVCSSGLSGDSYRFYQVEDERPKWAKLLSFPQLDTKLGWFSTTQLQKPVWDPKNKYLRSEVPKQGEASSCRQFSLYGWQKGHFHIIQVGLSGECEDNTGGDKDLIIFPFVEEVEKGQAEAKAPTPKD